MNLRDLAKDLAEQTGETEAKVYETLQLAFRKIAWRATAGERVLISGFGSFHVVHRKSRLQHDVQLGGVVLRKPHWRLVFKPSKKIKGMVTVY